MRSSILCIALFALLAGGLCQTSSGQIYSKTIPEGFETQRGNYATNWPLNTPTTHVWHWVYDWTQLYHQCPLSIVQLSFRAQSAGTVVTGGTYQNVTVQMASSLTDHATYDPVYANNLDTDLTTVFVGDITIPASPGGGTGPAPFNVNVPFLLPFEFDPTRQKDLVIILTTPGPNPLSTGLTLDGVIGPYAGRHGHISDPTATAANWTNFDAAPIIELQYSLGSTSHFNLDVSTSALSLNLQFSNIPANSVQGYTLFSTIPAPEFGRGPLFGIFPSAVTFEVILRPTILGDPLHWRYPAAGLFPDLGLNLPPGTMFPFLGQTWEFVGVAVGPLGELTGVTPPRTVTY